MGRVESREMEVESREPDWSAAGLEGTWVRQTPGLYQNISGGATHSTETAGKELG